MNKKHHRRRGNRKPTTTTLPSECLPPPTSMIVPSSSTTKKPHIFIATPCYGGEVKEGYARSLVDMAVKVSQTEGLSMTYRLLRGVALVTKARNILVAYFLANPDLTHLLFVDSDIAFSPHDVLRLLEASKDKPIVAATYPKKRLDLKRLSGFVNEVIQKDADHDFTDDELIGCMLDFTYNSVPIHDGNPIGKCVRINKGFVQISDVGTGFMMIRRDVLLCMMERYSMDDKFYGFFETMIDPISRKALGEDFAFCSRARALDFSIWMDLQTRVTHEADCLKFKGDVSQHFRVNSA